ncbi:zinc finger AN1 domain-containing stress-associated protein 12 [Quercus suber]|uniref:Zinc finger an1 domain-containing stress-associated protein 12 n=1 Tax=Quercus suber TaxID=58331 RepID=A0AAW0IP95_QUESU|nr:zinc finger AN1 domain-containing stress-associated protein 12-like [Quercus suber]POE79080.1 zinc finger an1 domain-containing stress-associated protein 12 [Quercus suber]
MLEKHEKSDNCDPKKKKKPTYPVRWCKEILPFSNTSTCKTFQLKVCLTHRFLADHRCRKVAAATVVEGKGRWNDRFLAAMASRNGRDCGSMSGHGSASTPITSSSVKAY